ncbi:MAG: hypothetical protein AABW49_00380 [Nanoarchaeota archaeon]
MKAISIEGTDGEYLTKGDYHKNLDKSWAYYPVYVCKMEIIRKYLDSLPEGVKVLVQALFPTFPMISFLTVKIPSKVVWLHRVENYLFGSMRLCFQNLYWSKKP